MGYTKEELSSMGVIDMNPNFSREWWRVHWRDIKERKKFTMNANHRKKDGTIFPVELNYIRNYRKNR